MPKAVFECPDCGSGEWQAKRDRGNIPWTPTRDDIGPRRTLLYFGCRACGWRMPLITAGIKTGREGPAQPTAKRSTQTHPDPCPSPPEAITHKYRRPQRVTVGPRASTKLLRGFAVSLSQKFASSYEYLMPTMRHNGDDCFRLDLLTGAMQPFHCEERRNRILADKIIDNWAALSVRFPQLLFVAAELVSFWDDPHDALDNGGDCASPWIETRITFEAADGRVWSGGIREPWPPRGMSQWQTLD